ncbi:hypothetical protein G9A89_017118 [Geosiphon pyriformis]|nr:hypothetical protein G9A89_017118 [Geosiphon pyriformis]
MSPVTQNMKEKLIQSYVFCYYVSGHGFGHATRVVQIATKLLALPRHHKLYIISNAPKFIFNSAISVGAIYRHALIDAGVNQPLAYTVDRCQTIKNLQTFLSKRQDLLDQEVNWLREVKADIVLSDAPFLPCAAAAEVGIPSSIKIRIVNKTPSNKSKALKQITRRIIDVPLVVRKFKNPREMVLKNLGIPQEIFQANKVLLVSFGGQILQDIDTLNSPIPDGWIAIVCGSHTMKGKVLPPRFYRCPVDAYVPDLTNAADVVMGKLGYGTCSECIAHSKPFIYVPRPQFIEEDGLKRLMEIQGSCVEMPKEDFELGHWSSYILHAYGMLGVCEESNQRLSHDGGEIVAQTLEQYLDERGGNFNIDLTRSSQATPLDSSVAALI